MNITTELDQEVWHDLQEAGAYEWWYFDAEDKVSGFSVVIIWFSGFPFSPYYTNHYERWKNRITAEPPLPSNYSGFSFQLYENNREIVNFIKEGSNGLFESSRSEIGVRFEQNCFTYNALTDEYSLDIDFSFPVWQKAIKASLLFKSCRRIIYEKKDGNKIRLVYWYNGKQSRKFTSDRDNRPMELGSTGFSRIVLNEDSLDYVFSRIHLLA